MSDIALVGTNHSAGGSEPPPMRVPDRLRPGGDRGVHRFDRDVRRWRRELADLEPREVRWDRVATIRAEIESGEYLTTARLDAAINGLLCDLSR